MLLFYLTATGCYIFFFIFQQEKVERAGLVSLAAGFIVHTGLLIERFLTLGRFPVIGLKESLCFFAWSLSGLYVFVRLRGLAKAVGGFLSPLVSAFFIWAAVADKSSYVIDERFHTALFPFHILLAFLGHSAFAFSCGASLMYLLQEKAVKRHRPGAFMRRLPSLKELDTLTYHSLTTGFFLLTLGIITGALWLHNIQGVLLSWDAKVAASVITWFFYALILHTRLLWGWRGRKTALLSITGFVCVMFTFLIAGYLKSGFHNFF